MEYHGTLTGPTDPDVIEWSDDFLGGGITSGTIGDTGWVETNSAAGTNLLTAGGVGKGSVFRLTTGATSGNNKRLHRGLAVTNPYLAPGTLDRFRWCVRVPTITTIVVRLGLMQDVSSATGGTAGAFVEFVPASAATWRFFTRQGGTSSPAVVGPTVTAGSWYLLEVRRRPSGTAWEFFANEASVGSSTSNLPTTDCNYGALLQTAAASARNLDFDYAYLRARVTQRHT